MRSQSGACMGVGEGRSDGVGFSANIPRVADDASTFVQANQPRAQAADTKSDSAAAREPPRSFRAMSSTTGAGHSGSAARTLLTNRSWAQALG